MDTKYLFPPSLSFIPFSTSTNDFFFIHFNERVNQGAEAAHITDIENSNCKFIYAIKIRFDFKYICFCL
jgi:hypothetical protein